MRLRARTRAHVEVRRELGELSSLLPPREKKVTQVGRLTELSQPRFFIFYFYFAELPGYPIQWLSGLPVTLFAQSPNPRPQAEDLGGLRVAI